MGIAYGVEILGNFEFHIIGNTLVLLDARKELIEIARLCTLILSRSRTGEFEEVAHHVEHALHTVGEQLNLLLGFEYREFGSLHETSRNEVQTEILVLIDLLRFDNPADETLDLRDEPNEDARVSHIETGVEGSQYETQLGRISQKSRSARNFLGHGGVVTHEAAYHIDEGAEDEENPNDTEDIEEHVCQGCTACLRISRHGSQIGSNGGTDVLTHDEGNTLIDRQYARRTENHGDSHDGCRRLHTEGEDAAQEQEDDGGGERTGVEGGEEIEHCLILAQMHVDARLSQRSQSQEHKGDTEEEIADITLLFIVDENDGNEESGIDKVGDVERETCRHDPCGERSTDIGTHDDGNSLCQREQTRIDKRNRHDGGGGTGLHGSGDEHTRQHSRETISGHSSQDMAELRARHLLQSLTH